MAGQGTGLPSSRGAAVTPLADTGGFGAAEEANAKALFGVAAALQDGMRQFVEPAVSEQQKALAAQEAVAGDFTRRFGITPDVAAFNDVKRVAQTASSRTSAEDTIAALAVTFQYEPDAFDAAAREARSALIESVPGDVAISVANHFDGQRQNRSGIIRAAATQRDLQRGQEDVEARKKRIEGRMLNTDPDTVEYELLSYEREQLQDSLVANPAFSYTENERLNDDLDITGRVTVATMSRAAMEAHEEAGGGLPGQAAAYRVLDEGILRSEDLSMLDPSVRVGLYNLGRSQIDAMTRTEMEEARAEAQRQSIMKEQQRETYESYALDLALGGFSSVSEIQALDDVDDGQKARLVSALETRQRSARVEARAAEAAVYNPLREEARAGLLSDEEIAQALTAGNIDDSQARTLRALRSTALRGTVNGVMAPFEDAARRPGVQGLRPINELRLQAETDAAAWAAANPEATLQDQLTYGKLVAEKHLGSTASTPGAPRNAGERQAQLQTLAAERERRARTPNPMPASEYNRRRQEITNGR